MCGIYGVLSVSAGGRPDPSLLDPLAQITRHRGPDDAGAYSDERIVLGMRRLSIIDVAGGHQPIANETGRIHVVCNGEIYNFGALRDQLMAAGHRFRTSSDTEVVVHGYEQWGDAVLERIDGMYALAVWDADRARLLVARDRLGIKPLYYCVQNGYFAFASEAKALLTLPWVRRELDPEALDTYLSLGYSSGEKSMFRGVRRLPPATALVLESGDMRQRRYWTLPAETDQTRSAADWADGLRAQLERSVRAQMVSDVPLGAFLSGGIDSSAVVAMMARASDRPVKTYSIGFGDVAGGRLYNELPYARTVAGLFRTDHREILVSPDVATLLPRLIWHLDEPLADAAFITTYLVSRFAREDVTVILSGVGGDELFGGYNRYLDEIYHRRYRLLPRALRQVIRALASRLPVDRHSALQNKLRLVRAFVLASERGFEDRYAAYVSVFGPEQLRRLRVGTGSPDAIAEAFMRAAGTDYLHRLLDVDMQTQLPDDLLMLTDRMSMAVSLECRVPLLDTPLVEMAARMPADVKIRGRELKSVLKASLDGILPDSILHRQKRGFGAPVGAWLRQELRPLLDHCLNERVVEARGLFRWDEVASTIALHMSSREDHTDHLLSLVNLEMWCRIHLDGVEPDALARELPGAAAS